MKKIAILTSLAFLFTGCAAQFELDGDSASSVLFSHRDFGFDVERSEDTSDIGEMKFPVFRASEDCEPDDEIAQLISRRGQVLASQNVGGSESEVYIQQDIVEFASGDSASELLELVRLGHSDEECRKNFDNEISSQTTTFEELESADEVFGVSSDGSLLWLVDQESKANVDTGGFNADLSSDGVQVVTRKGAYVLLLRGTVYDGADISVRDVERDFGIVVKQFLAGGPS